MIDMEYFIKLLLSALIAWTISEHEMNSETLKAIAMNLVVPFAIVLYFTGWTLLLIAKIIKLSGLLFTGRRYQLRRQMREFWNL